MKKNLLSIIILFLLIINISLTAVMMFSLVTTNRGAISLITDIATVLKLELPDAGVANGEYVPPDVEISKITTYAVAGGEAMTITLKSLPDNPDTPDVDEGKATNYVMIKATLSMDSTNKAYKKDAAEGDLSQLDAMIQDRIIRIFSRYTIDDIKDDNILENKIKNEIILQMHEMFGSDFIIGVSFRDVKYA